MTFTCTFDGPPCTVRSTASRRSTETGWRHGWEAVWAPVADHVEPEDLEAFRARVRAWIVDNLEPLNGADPFMGHAKDDADQVVRAKAIQRTLWDGGFAGLCYPVEYGDKGLPPAFQLAFNEQSRGYELPWLFNTPTLTIITPTL